MKPQFTLGRTVITLNALAQLDGSEIPKALVRHVCGDWGDVDPEGRAANIVAARDGLKVHSVYHDAGGVKFWVITDADRSLTTVLVPEDASPARYPEIHDGGQDVSRLGELLGISGGQRDLSVTNVTPTPKPAKPIH